MDLAAAPVRELVLVGGGHSHVQVLRSLGMRALPGVRVTIVSREVLTPYSGMLPGHVAGCYGWRDIHIDLGPLSRFAGARLIHDAVTAVDLTERRLTLAGHPPLRYDVLSLNSGAVPAQSHPAGQAVKPIGSFLPRWQSTLASARSGERVVLVGGGAGGVELALAMRTRLNAGIHITLVTDTLLAGHNAAAGTRLRRALSRRGITVREDFRVVTVDGDEGRARVVAEDGRGEPAEHLFWVTGVAAPEWIGRSGLAVDPAGFVRVDKTLRSISHPQVFAAGDVAALEGQPRAKSGVFAVREGPVLAENLRRVFAERPLRRYRAQRRFLAIVGTGDGRAVAMRGPWAVEGAWVWRWKDWIDRRFMARFQALPVMVAPQPEVLAPLRAELPDAMRCGGCGAKLGADPLRRVLARLPDQRGLECRRQVRLGIGDDAAVLHVERGELLLTVDGFRSLVDDAYLFGRITAHHSLNDVMAMGGQGIAALALATVPLMAESMMEEELLALLAGAVDVLNAHDVPLVGGHSAEGAELSLALTITGVPRATALGKAGLAPGQALLLNKPIGTGAVLAGHMRGRTPSDQLEAALAAMDHSNAAALDVLLDHGARALTDVSGFGLAGHLGEMLRASGCGATLSLSRVPLLPGAMALVEEGVVSSLQASNEMALADYLVEGVAPDAPALRLLADPQTSGGLLGAVPAEAAPACLQALHQAGYAAAAIIGTTRAGPAQVEA